MQEDHRSRGRDRNAVRLLRREPQTPRIALQRAHPHAGTRPARRGEPPESGPSGPRRRAALRAHARRLQAVERRREDRIAAGRAGRLTSTSRDHFLKGSLTPGGKRRIAPKTVNAAAIPRRHRAGTTSCSASVRPAPARRIWPWRRPWRSWSRRRSAASSWRARRSRRGRSSGFLPGDLQEKVNPYLRPLYDALYDMLDVGTRGAAHRARDDRDRADRVHARPHAERRVRHPRRGAEHDVRADEDVPDAPRLRLQGGDHRRHHADRPADGTHLRPGRGDEGRGERSTASRSSISTSATSSATSWCSRSSRPTRRSPARAGQV